MTVTLYKLSIVGVLLVLLAGCSLTGEVPVAGQWDTLQSEEQAKVIKSGAFEVCLLEPGPPFSYRKAILVAGTLGVPDLPRDLPGLAYLTSKRLQAHLDALERFKVLAAHDTSFESMSVDTAARVRRFGRQHDSQFVVKLEILDLSMQSSGGWLSTLFAGSTQPKLFRGSTQRNVLIKLYIYDTEYGALFHSQQYQGTVSGNVVGYPGNGRSVTPSWFNTDLGTWVDEILKAISVQINEKLACVPFSTDVIAVKGKDIHINAGYLDGIRPGETLRVYRRNYIFLPDGTQQQGTQKQGTNDGWIKVNTVFPNHSIANVTQEKEGGIQLDTGDVVRAW
jgi:hypothetical protein